MSKHLEAFRLAPPKLGSTIKDFKEMVDHAVTLHHSKEIELNIMGSILLRQFFDMVDAMLDEEGVTDHKDYVVMALYREYTGDNAITILITDIPKSEKGDNEFAYLAYNQDPAIGF